MNSLALKLEEEMTNYFDSRVVDFDSGEIRLDGKRAVLMRASACGSDLPFPFEKFLDADMKNADIKWWYCAVDMGSMFGSSLAKALRHFLQLNPSNNRESLLTAGPIAFRWLGFNYMTIHSVTKEVKNAFDPYGFEIQYSAKSSEHEGKSNRMGPFDAAHGSGWMSVSTGTLIGACEVQCAGMGHGACRFVGASLFRLPFVAWKFCVKEGSPEELIVENLSHLMQYYCRVLQLRSVPDRSADPSYASFLQLFLPDWVAIPLIAPTWNGSYDMYIAVCLNLYWSSSCEVMEDHVLLEWSESLQLLLRGVMENNFGMKRTLSPSMDVACWYSNIKCVSQMLDIVDVANTVWETLNPSTRRGKTQIAFHLSLGAHASTCLLFPTNNGGNVAPRWGEGISVATSCAELAENRQMLISNEVHQLLGKRAGGFVEVGLTDLDPFEGQVLFGLGLGSV